MNTNLGPGFAPNWQWTSNTGQGGGSSTGDAASQPGLPTLQNFMQYGNNLYRSYLFQSRNFHGEDDLDDEAEAAHPRDLARQTEPTESQIFGLYNYPKANAKTTIKDLPFDIIHEICKWLVASHASKPPSCASGHVQNNLTSQNELNLVLHSQSYNAIVDFLNTRTAKQDMLALGLTCKQLYEHVQAAIQTLDAANSLHRPLRVKQIWFEDLSWMMTRLTGFGFQNLTTLQIWWDNRERIANTMYVPRVHRHNQAARGLFNALRVKCTGLRTLEVKIAFEMLRLLQADGTPRKPPLKTYRDIPGMDELKALVQAVCGRRGGGYATLGLATDDRGAHTHRQPFPESDAMTNKKKAILQWLEDGHHVALEPFVEPTEEEEVAAQEQTNLMMIDKEHATQEQSNLKVLEEEFASGRWDAGDFDTPVQHAADDRDNDAWKGDESYEGHVLDETTTGDASGMEVDVPATVRQKWAAFNY